MPGNASSASKSRGSSPPCSSTQTLRGRVQVAGAGVVAEPGPQREHVVERRRRQRGDIRQCRDETLEVGNHHPHLRLLQHDFRQPHPVRRARMLPGQVVAAGDVEPGQQVSRRNGRRSLRFRRAPATIGSSNSTSTPSSCAPAMSSRGVVRCPDNGGNGEPVASAAVQAVMSAMRKRASKRVSSRCSRSAAISREIAAAERSPARTAVASPRRRSAAGRAGQASGQLGEAAIEAEQQALAIGELRREASRSGTTPSPRSAKPAGASASVPSRKRSGEVIASANGSRVSPDS